jgi:hypothetical protein
MKGKLCLKKGNKSGEKTNSSNNELVYTDSSDNDFEEKNEWLMEMRMSTLQKL